MSTTAERWCRISSSFGLAFICAREAWKADSLGPQLKKRFGGAYIVNEQFTRETADQIIHAGDADAVAFGKAYIANPDLVERLRGNTALNTPDTATFYSDGPAGYTDYPSLEACPA